MPTRATWKWPRNSLDSRFNHSHLDRELQPLPYVHAFWEAGATAFNRIDEWSDIDLYIVVDDAAAVSETFLIVEKTLTALSPIRLRHEVS